MRDSKIPEAEYTQAVSLMVDATCDLIDGMKSQVGPEGIGRLYVSFLRQFVGVIAMKALRAYPAQPVSKNDLYLFTQKNFATMKQAVQEAVSEGFATAMTKYTGASVEYYCTIKTVPPVTNTLAS